MPRATRCCVALAPRLIEAVRATDTVARLGGDEFVVICPAVDAPRGATEVAERLAAAVSRPLVLDSGEHFFTVSIGVALAMTPEDTPESLLGDADAAMYRAKDRGRGRYELFDEAMRVQGDERACARRPSCAARSTAESSRSGISR